MNRADEAHDPGATARPDRSTASEVRDASSTATTNDPTDSVPTSLDNSDDAPDQFQSDGIAASADELAAMAAAEAVLRGQLPTMPVTPALLAPDAGGALDMISAFDAAGGDAAQASNAVATEADRAAARGLASAGELAAAAQFPSSAATATTATATDAATIAATASEDTANTAVSTATQDATAALAANTNNVAQRARAGLARGPAETAGSTQSAAARANDPLARLIQSSQDALAAAQAGGNAQGAVAGRLAEVEAGIARDRAQRAISGTGATIAIDGDAPSAGKIPGAAESDAEGIAPAASTANGREAAQASLATGALAPDASRGGGSLSTSAIGAGIAQGPASDLAFASDDSSSPAAQIAAKGAEILAKQRGGAITMRLEPPALGQLKVELRIAHGSVVADFTAATPEARVLLESSMGMLRERLESQGLGVERITVHGGRAPGEAAATQNAQQGDARSQGDARGDGSGRQSDGGARQDAAGGESRGRRDGERAGQEQDHGGRGRNGSHASDQPVKRGFAGALADAGAVNGGRNGTNATRTAESVRRAG